uniref:J domain-containing protein n=1 Tax=Coccolithus braarudii TaxID=221442 RepID=A0A7S0PTP7_9EUKA
MRRAACFEAAGDALKAAADFKRVLELHPESGSAAEGLHRCGQSCAGRGRGRPSAPRALGDSERAEEPSAYALLGIPEHASSAQIKQAYRKAALMWHPDRHSAAAEDEKLVAEARFKQLNLAHAVLSDAIKRRQYDAGASIRDLTGGQRARSAYSEA